MATLTENEFDSLKALPHLVIIGAGGSYAVMEDLGLTPPSTMDHFLENTGMLDVLDGVRLNTSSSNLEDIYSELASRSECVAVCHELEKRLYQYFSGFSLPPLQISIYDILILSLKAKDCIITFNWDPLLFKAYYRVERTLIEWGIHNPKQFIPHIHFLHGNVGIGLCYEHRNIGPINGFCPICHKSLMCAPLLYPVKHKDYTSDALIKNEWTVARNCLQITPYITVFGYGAPKSDREVIRIFQEAAGNKKKKYLEKFEVINKKGADKKELRETWDDFICQDHYDIWEAFYESSLAQHARRTIEDFVEGPLKGSWDYGPQPLPEKISWNIAEDIFLPLIHKEKTCG